MPTVFCPGSGATMRTVGTFEVQREVVGEGRDLVEPQAGFQRDLVLRDDRPGVDADDLDVEAEVDEGLLQQRGHVAQLLLVLLERERVGVAEQRQRRQLVVGVRGGSSCGVRDETASPASACARCGRGSGCRRGSPAPSRERGSTRPARGYRPRPRCGFACWNSRDRGLRDLRESGRPLADDLRRGAESGQHLLAAVGHAIVAPHRSAPQPAKESAHARAHRARASRPRGRARRAPRRRRPHWPRAGRVQSSSPNRRYAPTDPPRPATDACASPAPNQSAATAAQVVSTAQPVRRMPSRAGERFTTSRPVSDEPAQRGRPRPPSRADRPGAPRRRRRARRGGSCRRRAADTSRRRAASSTPAATSVRATASTPVPAGAASWLERISAAFVELPRSRARTRALSFVGRGS